MKITHIHLKDHRNYEDRTLHLSDFLNIIIGPNGAGKTNILESITLLSTGASHRTKSLTELIRHGQPGLFIQLSFLGEARMDEQELSLGLDSKGKKRFRLNGVLCKKAEDAGGQIVTVMFSPDDLWMIKGEPEGRRTFLNDILTQTSHTYRHSRGRFLYALRQRNELLRTVRDRGSSAIKEHTKELDAIDAVFASYAAPIFRERAALIDELSAYAREAFGTLVPHKELDVQYQPRLEEFDNEVAVPAREALSEMTDLEEMFRAALFNARQRDVRLGLTTSGPHRDDLLIMIDGQAAKNYSSQGEQRAAVLSLKFGELRYKELHFGERPVLLLDDVLSELDAERRSALLKKVDEGYQTLITTTNAGYFSSDELERSNIIELTTAWAPNNV